MPDRDRMLRNAVVLGRARVAGRRMLFPRNIARRLFATSRLLVIATSVRFCLAEAGAQQPAAPAATDPASGAFEVPAAQIDAAYAKARRWVTAFDTPPMDDPESQAPLDNASAVCVILRRGGKVMGTGVDCAGDGLMLRRALGHALNETLGDPAMQSLSASIQRDVRADATTRPQPERDKEIADRLDALRRDVGRTLTLELEVAGPRSPLVGGTLEQLARKIDPGIDGVALRHEQAVSYLFPAQQRLSNAAGDAQRALIGLALGAGLTMSDLGNVSTRQDVSFYLFRTIDLMQSAAEAPPTQTLRGESPVRQEDVTRQRIVQLADALALHIMRTQWPPPPEGHTRPPLGLMGDYNPVSDQFQPLVAPPLEQALCAWALARYAQCSAVDQNRAKDAVMLARQVLRDLAEVGQGEQPPAGDLAACAALLLLAAEMPSCLGDASIAQLMADARKRLESVFDAAHGFVAQPPRDDNAGDGESTPQPVSPMVRGMIACAWARLLKAKIDTLPAPPEMTIRAALDAAWESLPQAQQITLLPWMGWGEMDFAAGAGQPPQHLEDLRRLVSVIERARITRQDQPTASPDLLGGLALISASAGDHPKPGAQTLRPAAWLAGAATDQALTPKTTRPAVRDGFLQTMRFVCQLTCSDVRAASFRNASRAAGGICASPWDARQPAAAQAMGLIAAVEAIRNWPAAGE